MSVRQESREEEDSEQDAPVTRRQDARATMAWLLGDAPSKGTLEGNPL